MSAVLDTAQRLRRLARRPPGYVVGRALRELRSEADRLAVATARTGRAPLPLRRLLRGDLATPTRLNVAAMAAWGPAAAAVRSDRALATRVRGRAEDAATGSVMLFGDEPQRLARPIDWLTDPRSGLRFEPGFHRRLDYRRSDVACDVKFVWELSRLRPCVELAQGHAALGEVDWLETLLGDLDGWISANPLGWTVNWAVAMEVALRSVNLICVDGLLVAAGVDDRRRAPLVASLYEHGWFLARNLEVSHLNGNHFLADAVGLLWLGRYFEGVGQASEWTARGTEMILQAAREQILPDGMDHEGSLPYHVLVLELFLLALVAEPHPGPDVEQAVDAMIDAACAFVAPDGTVPNLGDDDGGRAVALSDVSSRDARRVLALAAGLRGHARASARAGSTDQAAWEDLLWLRGPEAAPSPPAPPPAPPIHLSSAGVVVLGGADDHVVVDVGPVGFRGCGGHGHLDAMSFEARLAGALVVRDSGTSTYTGDVRLRERLRDAPAHTLVQVDGLPYATLGGHDGLWRIEGDAPPEVETLEGNAERQRLVAVQQLPAAMGTARWRREVAWRAGSLECTDEVEAPIGASVRHYVQAPAGATLEGSTATVPTATYVLAVPEHASISLEAVPASERYGSVAEGTRLVVAYDQREPVERMHLAIRPPAG